MACLSGVSSLTVVGMDSVTSLKVQRSENHIISFAGQAKQNGVFFLLNGQLQSNMSNPDGEVVEEYIIFPSQARVSLTLTLAINPEPCH
jgi:hypothetical protein